MVIGQEDVDKAISAIRREVVDAVAAQWPELRVNMRGSVRLCT
jgi:hypothetical protein